MAEWSTLPVSVGDEPNIAHFNEIRTAIERRRALVKGSVWTIWGAGGVPSAKIAGDEIADSSALQRAIQSLVNTHKFYLYDSGSFYLLVTDSTPTGYQKNIFTEALGGGLTDWRSGSEPVCELNIHTPNDMKSVLELLTVVRVGCGDMTDITTEEYSNQYSDSVWVDARADAFTNIADNSGSATGLDLGRRGKGQIGSSPPQYYCEAYFVEGGKIVAQTADWDLSGISSRVQAWLRLGAQGVGSADHGTTLDFKVEVGGDELGGGSVPYGASAQAVNASLTANLFRIGSGSNTDFRFYFDGTETDDPTGFLAPTNPSTARWWSQGPDNLGSNSLWMPSGVAPAGLYLQVSW